jgi:hypothetical protein
MPSKEVCCLRLVAVIVDFTAWTWTLVLNGLVFELVEIEPIRCFFELVFLVECLDDSGTRNEIEELSLYLATWMMA